MKSILTAITALLSISTFAAAPPNFPKDLLYQDKPIDGLCFYQSENPSAEIPLSKCGLNAGTDQKATGQNQSMLAKGFVGYDYNTFTDGKKSPLPDAYSYYKVLGSKDNVYILYALNNTGGTGQFTNIFLVRRDGDSIRVSSIAAGDRCNQGIADAQVSNQQLSYTIYITPADFLSLANDNPFNLKPYDDLDACASCCIAQAAFQIDLKGTEVNPQLVAVNIAEPSGQEEQSSFQTCFNNLVSDYQKQGKLHLNEQQFDEFVRTFNQECVRKDA